MRRGRASQTAAGLSPQTDADLELASGEDDDRDEEVKLASWLQGNQTNPTWDSLFGNGQQTMVTRWLPPGNVSDLYLEYVATQSLVQQPTSSSGPWPFRLAFALHL